MAPRRKQEQRSESIFDTFDRLAGREGGNSEPSADVKALQAKIEEQGRLLQELTQRGQREYPMIQQTAPASGQQHTLDPAKVTISLEGLPDRETDPDGYWREYNSRANAAMQAQTHAVTQQLTQKFEQERAADRLWNGFKQAHPEWVKYESLVETVTNRVATDLQNKGVDLQRLIQGHPDRFYQEIDTALRQQYGKLVETDDGEGEDEDNTVDPNDPMLRPDPSIDPLDTSRTEGIGAGGGPAPRGKAPEKGADFFDDLRAVQKRMGVI